MNDDPLLLNFDNSQLKKVSILGGTDIDQAIFGVSPNFDEIPIGMQDVGLVDAVLVSTLKNPWFAGHGDKLTCIDLL